MAAAARVIRVPRFEEHARWAPPAAPGGGASSQPAVRAKKTAAASPEAETLVFDLEGFPDAHEAEREQVSESAKLAAATVARLLVPGLDDGPIHSAALLAAQAGGDDLHATAAALQRMGWSAKVCSSRGGTLRQLRHTHLTATRHTYLRGEPAEWVIDPSFSQAFQVADPTPRYAHVLSGVPAMVVAPLGRLLRAVLLLGAELERCFEQRGMPLPPWRSADALTSRYEQAAAAPSAAPASAAAERKQQQRVEQQQERVQLRLLKLGLALQQPSATAAAVTAASPPSPSSSSSGSSAGDPDSPLSVLEASQGAHSRAFPQATKAPECFCWGWREHDDSSRPGRQRRRWPRRIAASAA